MGIPLLCAILPVRALDNFSRVSLDTFLPLWVLLIMSLISSDLFLTLLLAAIFSLCFACKGFRRFAFCSSVKRRPEFFNEIRALLSLVCLLPDDPSPPEVLLRRHPVPRSIRPHHDISRRSSANAPTSVNLVSNKTILEVSLGIGNVCLP